MRKKKKYKTKVAGVNRPFLIIVLACWSLFYGIWRTFFTIPTNSGWLALILGSALVISELTTIVGALVHFFNTSNVKIPTLPEIKTADYPTVDVFVPTYDEDVSILYKTLNSCVAMDYPDKSKVKIHLCDDGNRTEMRQLAADFQVNYFHAPDNKFAKAGNLNYAVSQTEAACLVIFDADMIPKKNFLLETIPYFSIKDYLLDDGTWRKRTEDELFTEKPLAFVQTRQSFYNKDIFQQNLNIGHRVANDQDYFHREVNVARLNMHSVMFAGSNGVILREAFEQVGGFPTNSITEDLALSIELWGDGFQGIALDKRLAHGMAPETATGLIKQRGRWSRGAAQCIVTPKFLFKKMSFGSKLGFFMAYAHWWTYIRRLIFIICPIAYGVFGVEIAHIKFWQLLLIFIPYLLIYNYSLRKMSRGRLSAFYSALTDTILFPYMLWPIIAGTLNIPKSKFEVTPKDNLDQRNSKLRYTIPFIILILLSIITIQRCLVQVFSYSQLGALPVLYWAIYNILTLILAVPFYVGRKITREDIMMKLSLPIKIDHQEFETTLMGDDIFAVKTTQSFAKNETFEIRIENISFLAQAYHFNNHSDETFFEIIDWSKPNHDAYLQMLYERPISLPDTVRLNYFHGLMLLIHHPIYYSKIALNHFQNRLLKLAE